MPKVRVDYIPKPKQRLFHESAATECFFGGAKSPGKSCALVMEAVAYALENKGADVYLFRKTYDDLKANLIQEFMSRVPKEVYEYNQADHIATINNSGSKIYFRFMRNLIDAYSYNGRSIPFVGVDELTQHEEQAIQILLSCNRSAKGFPIRFRATGNPGSIGHQWCKDRYVTKTEKGKHSYIDKVTGNEIAFIPANVYDGVLVERDPAYVKRLENLPETEKQAYLYGDWDIFEGQFFSEFGEHNREVPFKLPYDCQDRLIGSLDHGIAHNTSAGLWYIAPDKGIHRLCSYSQNGGTTRGHAIAIWDIIESFEYSHGYFPVDMYFDPSMDTQRKMSEQFYQSDLDEYKNYFNSKEQSKNVNWIPANNRKVDGCHIMREAFSVGNGKPSLFFFDGYNQSFESGIKAVMYDKNNREIYAKMDGDDESDEARYGIVAARSFVARQVTKEIERKRDRWAVDDDKPFGLEVYYSKIYEKDRSLA